MTKLKKNESEIRRLIADELSRADLPDVDPASLVVVATHSRWLATLRSDARRLDEASVAAVAEVSLRLADLYDIAEPA